MARPSHLINGPGPWISEYGRSLYAQPADITHRYQGNSRYLAQERDEYNDEADDFTSDHLQEVGGDYNSSFRRRLNGCIWADLASVEIPEDEEEFSTVLSTFSAPPPLQSSLLNSPWLPPPSPHLTPSVSPPWVDDYHYATLPPNLEPLEQIRGVKRSRIYDDGYYGNGEAEKGGEEEEEGSEKENPRPSKLRKLTAKDIKEEPEDTEEEDPKPPSGYASDSSASESGREYDGSMTFWYKKEKRQKCRRERKQRAAHRLRRAQAVDAREAAALPEGHGVNSFTAGRKMKLDPRAWAKATALQRVMLTSFERQPSLHDPTELYRRASLSLKGNEGGVYEEPLLPSPEIQEMRPRAPVLLMEPRQNYPALWPPSAQFALKEDPFNGYISMALSAPLRALTAFTSFTPWGNKPSVHPPSVSSSRPLTSSERRAAKQYLKVTAAMAQRASTSFV
ncbi:hypothetical protein F5Y09DRAFT_347357 [Xylaria sp. FL1042]|nr:hypothetical protein F5Y09DRAFT_347357 [Xylaria sp. FL1042]